MYHVVCIKPLALWHYPLTIRKETQSLKWTGGVSLLVPTITGIVVCLIVAQGARVFGLV